MHKAIVDFFENRKIEYFAALAYSECREIDSDIIEREALVPRSAILFLLPYYVSEGENISTYATSLDYHIILKEITGELCSLLAELYPGSRAKGYGDHSPIDERHAALISGLGIRGDNGLLISEKYGSYIFLGDVITDIAPEDIGALLPTTPRECLHCGACLSACPTGILGGCGTDCLSAITQRKGELSLEERELMRKYNTAWGCDECQRACPYNKQPVETPIDFFRRERVTALSRPLLDGMNKSTLRARAFGWRGRAVLERNLDILSKEK